MTEAILHDPRLAQDRHLQQARILTRPARIERKLALRGYQQEALDRTYAALERGVRRPVVTMATGAGKTVYLAHIVADFVERGERVLFLAHRDEILVQAIDKLRDVVGDAVDIGLVKAAVDEHHAQVVVASVQTLAQPRRLARFPHDFGLIVVDECHHAPAESYQRIMKELRVFADDGPILLGVTATLDRADGVGLDGTFQEVVYEISTIELIRSGYLVDIEAHQVAIDADFSSLHSRAGDVIASEAGDLLLAAKAPATVATAIAELASERRTLVFTPTVNVAYAISDACQEEGLTAAGVDGETPLEERRAILDEFRSGDIQVLTNCSLFTEGTDIPPIDNVVIARPTRSRALYSQMIGRGLRPYPGKKNCMVLDCVGSTIRHDLVTPASLLGLKPKDLTGSSVLQAILAKDQADKQTDGWGSVAHGQLITAAVDVLRQRPVSWVPAQGGRFALSTGRGSLIVRPRFGDRWDVIEMARGNPARILVEDLSFGAATGYAEDYVRSLGAGALIDRNAPWRQAPPSDKQLRALQKFGIPLASIRTKGDASDALSAAIAVLEVA